MIAALFVDSGGAYFNRPGVDPWDKHRDARLYAGPWPVVAHPPCSRWCQLAHINQKRWGARVGDDGGTFAAALAAVRTWGGVLEHPAYSYAWPAFQLAPPPRMGWAQTIDGGWVAQVSQSAYGHRARKLTWLYYVGKVAPASPDWGQVEASAVVSMCANRGDSPLPRLRRRAATATPAAFRDYLLKLAAGSPGPNSTY